VKKGVIFVLRDPDSITLETLADYNIDRVEQDFEVITIYLRDGEIDSTVIIRCKDYIGQEMIGLWDDSMIKSITIENSGDFIKNSLKKVMELYSNPDNIPGCVKKTKGQWKQIIIKLIDGVEFKVACADIEVEY
jgi:hypothetical protein